MQQKLRASTYMKNNKRRIAVLIVSLGSFIAMIFAIQFLLSATPESFKHILINKTENMQMISYGYSYLFPDEEVVFSDEFTVKDYRDKMKEGMIAKAEKLRADYPNITFITCATASTAIIANVGSYYFEFPLCTRDEVDIFLKNSNAKLISGRMPEASDEVILDKRIADNRGYSLGQRIDDAFTLVGLVDSDDYFAAGIAPEETSSIDIYMLSGGDMTLKEAYEKYGYDTEDIDKYNKDNERELEELVSDIDGPSKLIMACASGVLCFCLFIVFNMFIRDRHDEWCLYHSIGYSLKDIYKLIAKELLITFLLSIAFAVVFGAIVTFILLKVIVEAGGLYYILYTEGTMTTIVTVVLTLIALLQIPVFVSLKKIRTIDACDDIE